MENLPKKSLAIFSLTSCEGCEFEMLSFYDHINQIQKFYDIQNFRLGQEENFPGPFDVVLIEGSPDNAKQIFFLKKIRGMTKTIVALGACAHLGGIQSQRNRLPKELINHHPVKTVSDIIKVDFTLPGCPVSHNELVRALMDIYWEKTFTLPDLAVCFECRQNENKCLIKRGLPCLGPVTRGGCNSVCINGGEACLGCRGPMEQSNFKKIRQVLKNMMPEDELENWLTIYGDYEAEYEKLNNK